MSREDVIEHLINNGFLPVEVTELGRIPITVGVPDIGGDQKHSLSKKFAILDQEVGRQQR